MHLTGCPCCGPDSISTRGIVYRGIILGSSLHMCFLVHWSGRTKARTITETVIKSRAGPAPPPYKKCFQSRDDHEMPMDESGLQRREKQPLGNVFGS